MRLLSSYKLLIGSCILFWCATANAQFAPAAGKPGSTAIHKDSMDIVDWASKCTITRGPMDVSDNTLGLASIGREKEAFGKADNFVVSLGDGGNAVIEVEGSIYNGDGPDFAIFENAFDDNFLELAFVEVSSNGSDYVRFPAESLTPTNTQIGGFDYLDPTHLNNFAGKYRVDYGVPFDLEELKDSSAVDIDKVTHIRLVDVIGNIDTTILHSRDSKGNLVNDPWPTPFESSGFDLDAVGFIHLRGNSIGQTPGNELLAYSQDHSIKCKTSNVSGSLKLYSLNGTLIQEAQLESQQAFQSQVLNPGTYLISVTSKNSQFTRKVIVL